MCMYNVLKRFGAFVAALVLCFALSVSALAAESVLSGNATVTFGYRQSSGSSWQTKTQNGSGSPWSISSGVSNFSGSPYNVFDYNALALKSLTLSASLVPSGGISSLYLSFYYYATSTASSQNHAPSASDFSLRFRDSSTGSYSSSPVTISLFAPSTDVVSKSDGVTVKARYTNSPSSPIDSVILYNGSSDSSTPSFYLQSVSGSGSYAVMISSFRVVSTATNAELDALEEMASNIAQQSQILSQFYGDIVAVCNQIYQRLGDLQAAQEEANALFANVIKLLNTTNGKLEAINMAMSSYFELLINQLKQEGVDIRTAIADAEARLEVYLKPMIDYFNELEEQTGESASTLPQHKQDIEGFNNDGFGIDSDGQTGLNAIVPIFTAFSFILSVLGIFVGLGVLKIIIKKGLS